MPPAVHLIANATTASWDLSISDADYAKFRRSLLAKNSDDKWSFVALTPQGLIDQLTRWGSSPPDEELLRKLRDEANAMAVPDRVETDDQPLTDEESTDEESMNGETTDEESMETGTQATQLTDDESVDDSDPAESDYESYEEREEPTLDLRQPGYVSIFRAWSSWEYYRIAVKPRDGDTPAKIVSITWDSNEYPPLSWREGDPGPDTSEETAKREVVILCRAEHHLGCDLEAAPESWI